MIEIEHQLRSTSKTIIWQLLSTAPGLAKWIADSVTQSGDTLTFTWGDVNSHHEMRTATVLRVEKFNRIRWRWNDDGEATFVEIRMQRDQLTEEYALHITDFADDDDRDWLFGAWNHNFERLHQSSGL